MNGVNRIGKLDDQLGRVARRLWLTADFPGEAAAIGDFHREVRLPLAVTHVEDLNHVRVTDLR